MFMLPCPGVGRPLHSGDLQKMVQKYNTSPPFKLTIREALVGKAKTMYLLKELLDFDPLMILFGMHILKQKNLKAEIKAKYAEHFNILLFTNACFYVSGQKLHVI